MSIDKFKMHDPKPVTLGERYNAAWAEYNSRIAARYSLTQLYVAVSLALLAALFAYRDQPQSQWAFISVSAASFIYALLLLMHDQIMGCLHHYLQTCERVGNKRNMPSYHHHQTWRGYFLPARIYQNVLFALMSTGFSVAAWLTLSAKLDSLAHWVHGFFLAGAIVVYSIGIVVRFRWVGETYIDAWQDELIQIKHDENGE